MDTSDMLCEVVRHRHDELEHGLAELRERFRPHPREETARVGPRYVKGLADRFLAGASRHVNAANDVLLPAARRKLPDGKQVVHDYLKVTKELEVVLAHVKAHEYGSTYETGFSWREVWAELESALTAHREVELQLAARLDEALSPEDADAIADRLLDREVVATTRPHPYVPHTGLLGAVGRKVMHVADSFWDDAEGRMVPERHKVHKKPGLIGQYLMANPRFDEER